MHHHAQALQAGCGGQVLVEKLCARKGLDAFDLERLGHKGAHACGDKDGTGYQLCALGSGDSKAPIGLRLDGCHLCAQVPLGLEGGDLVCEPGGQLVAGAHRYARDVVDGFVAVQLYALAARVRQCVNDVGHQALQAQLKHLEQADGARADHDGIGFLDHRCGFWMQPQERERKRVSVRGGASKSAQDAPLRCVNQCCVGNHRSGWACVSPALR